MKGKPELLQIIHAGDPASLLSGTVQGRKKNRRKDRYNCYYHKEFYQCEESTTQEPSSTFPLRSGKVHFLILYLHHCGTSLLHFIHHQFNPFWKNFHLLSLYNKRGNLSRAQNGNFSIFLCFSFHLNEKRTGNLHLPEKDMFFLFLYIFQIQRECTVSEKQKKGDSII